MTIIADLARRLTRAFRRKPPAPTRAEADAAVREYFRTHPGRWS